MRLIPLRDFFRNPDQTAFTLSPDGGTLAFLAPWEGRLNVHVRDLATGDERRLTGDRDRDIHAYTWAADGRILYFQDQGGDENHQAFAVDVDGSNPLPLTPFEGVKTDLVDDLRDDPDHVLLQMNRRDPQVFDVMRVNVHTGVMETVAENPGNVVSWLTDNAGRLRCAVTSDGVNTSLLYRESEDVDFDVVLTLSFKDSVTPLAFTFDDRDLYVASNLERDTQAIYRFDPRTTTRGELLFEHDEVDVASLLRSRHRKVVTGVHFTVDKGEYHFFDDDRRELQERLEREFPDCEVSVTSTSRDERRVLAVTYSDRARATYYFLDRDADALTKIVDVAPWIDPAEMAPMTPVAYETRDGLTLRGYLTLPVDRGDARLPVVINPHGGPWARDHWGYNPEVQFLANRGYAVLQVNFRGSVGFGRKHWMASFKEWGRSMQDDLTDGVRWLVDQGIADPARVGIYGGSYGGYAVLAGLAFSPEVYACGVDYVGVSNLFTLLDSMPPYWQPLRDMMYEMVGHPETDADLLREISPVFHADRIQAPLLVAQGANDPRVKQAESDQIVAALKERGIDVPYIVKDNEGHGFHNEENKLDLYRAMERFLAEHLGGRAEPDA